MIGLGMLIMVSSKIFIVEDQIILANDLKLQLENLGYMVVGIAGNGKKAIKKIGEIQPDLILMDIVIRGDMDGIETAQKIRDLYNIPFIYLTAYFDDEILERASKTQPYGYITKPYNEIGLKTAIKLALYKHHLEKNNKPQAINL
jgi:CheY-like chemotaxis protein